MFGEFLVGKCWNKKKRGKETINEDLSKSFYKNDQSKSFINSLNGDARSVSLIDFKNRSSLSTSGVGNRLVLKPPTFNYSYKIDSTSDSDFVDDNDVEDNSSSIISGMTNLYLEKTGLSIKSNKINSTTRIEPKKFDFKCDSQLQQVNKKKNIYIKGRLSLC
jgi:hypothetical protein